MFNVFLHVFHFIDLRSSQIRDMKTRKLDLADLKVDSFETTPQAPADGGTVRGNTGIGCTDLCNDSYGGCSGAGCTGETICESCDGCNTASCGYNTGCDVLVTCDDAAACDTFTDGGGLKCNGQGTWPL